MFLIILGLLLVLFSLYIGIMVGIKDCKRRFHIPKGVESMEEWSNYYVKELENSLNE